MPPMHGVARAGGRAGHAHEPVRRHAHPFPSPLPPQAQRSRPRTAAELGVDLHVRHQRGLVNAGAARRVDEHGVALHHVQALLVDQVARVLVQVAVQRHHLVGRAQERASARPLLVSMRECPPARLRRSHGSCRCLPPPPNPSSPAAKTHVRLPQDLLHRLAAPHGDGRLAGVAQQLAVLAVGAGCVVAPIGWKLAQTRIHHAMRWCKHPNAPPAARQPCTCMCICICTPRPRTGCTPPGTCWGRDHNR